MNWESLGIVFGNVKKKHILLYIGVLLLGVFVAIWRDLWFNETTETIMETSLLVSVITLVITNYYTIENAIEIRDNNKTKLLSDYCARFSNDPNLNKVAEWLLLISELDTEGNVLGIIYNKKIKANKNLTVVEPTYFEKERFFDFLIELNNQIKNKKIEREDTIRVFSLYAQMFAKVLQIDNKTTYDKRDRSNISELLSEYSNK